MTDRTSTLLPYALIPFLLHTQLLLVARLISTRAPLILRLNQCINPSPRTISLSPLIEGCGELSYLRFYVHFPDYHPIYSSSRS